MLAYIRHEQRAFAFVTWRAAIRENGPASFGIFGAASKSSDLRRRLTPSYRLGCKRILISNDFYPAMEPPQCRIGDGWTIKEIRPECHCRRRCGGTKGRLHYFRDRICRNGLPGADAVTGRHGHDLHQSWNGGAEAYLGMTVAGISQFLHALRPQHDLVPTTPMSS